MNIDTNDNAAAHIALLKQRGVTAIGRYYSSSAWKRITKQEAAALSGAGFKIFTIFEDSGDPHLSDQNGIFHGQLAANQAALIGQPQGSAIYFALEHLPSGYVAADLPRIENYLTGLRQGMAGKYKLGIYSDGVVCADMLSKGLCDYTWLSASSSFEGSKAFYASGQWSLAQSSKVDQDWSGLSVDVNEAKPDFGGFTVAASVTSHQETDGSARPPRPAAAMSTANPTSAPAGLPGGWVLRLQRERQERRPGEGFDRTVGTYAVFQNGLATGLHGTTVERQGPGNNGSVGKASHTCIAAGHYPLVTHRTAKYATEHYVADGGHPRPAIEIGSTGQRVGILIHPADGYGSTIGCINLAGALPDADANIVLPESIARVIALIDDLKTFAGGLPSAGKTIDGATILIEDFV